MLWVKSFHIIFMVTWFAGLFYLPRLFVYHAQTEDAAGNARFKVMERKLFFIMTLGAAFTLFFGLWLLLGWHRRTFATEGWLHLKLVLVSLLFGYHYLCWRLMRDFRADRNRHGHVFYRWFNEFPALVLILVVILAVVRPF
ncbi:MAG: protoporphyrinogen oxidase HemJ [Gammaproteobacteria bacterium]|nr:MAG: protoporphyrinogen oxidase HemJ [Gammaproteobacteria bacterium]